LLNFEWQVPSQKVPVDVNTIVQTAIKHYQPQFSSHRIELQVSLGNELPQISGDPNQLLQVFLHIESNALNALDEVGGGIFSIKSRRKQDAIVLEFSDNGPGARDPERVFDPFYTTRAVGKGSGLGLSACYGIVRDHQGLILCANRVEGGTTIRIELPAVGTKLPAPADEIVRGAEASLPEDSPSNAALGS
jgi:two-component system NtrC family sensor kinase